MQSELSERIERLFRYLRRRRGKKVDLRKFPIPDSLREEWAVKYPDATNLEEVRCHPNFEAVRDQHRRERMSHYDGDPEV